MVKKKYARTKLLQFIDDITVYPHDQTIYQIVLRINDNLIRQYRRAARDRSAGKYVILTDVEPIKIKDELVVRSNINDILLVYNTRSQNIEPYSSLLIHLRGDLIYISVKTCSILN